jgi:hypothetical protein
MLFTSVRTSPVACVVKQVRRTMFYCVYKSRHMKRDSRQKFSRNHKAILSRTQFTLRVYLSVLLSGRGAPFFQIETRRSLFPFNTLFMTVR